MIQPAGNDDLKLKTSPTLRAALRQRAFQASHSDDPAISSLADSLDILLDDIDALLTIIAQRGQSS